MTTELSFLEKFIILVLDEKTGKYKFEISLYIELLTLSAYLFELVLEEKMYVLKDKIIVNEKNVNTLDYLKPVNIELSREDKDYLVKDFLLHFFNNNHFDLHTQSLLNLSLKNILKAEEKKVLGVFETKMYQLTNPEIKFEIKKTLRFELMQENQLSLETACLVFLLRESGLVEDNFQNYDTTTIFKKAENIENQTNLPASLKALMEGVILAKRTLDNFVTVNEIL